MSFDNIARIDFRNGILYDREGNVLATSPDNITWTTRDATMPEKIEPALSAEEFREIDEAGSIASAVDWIAMGKESPDAQAAAAIAVANHMLPDSDFRKITRTHVNALRFAADALRERGAGWAEKGVSPGIENEQAKTVARLADALESYLPPET